MSDAWELDTCPFCGGTDITRRQRDGVDDQQCNSCWGYWAETDLASLDERQVCPRRQEAPSGMMTNFASGSDFWRAPRNQNSQLLGDGVRTCSYCGSMNPDDLMAALRVGAVEMGPTDKSYKAYVELDSGAKAKFYYMHLSVEQRKEFVELYNAGMRVGYPGHFYVSPFFMAPAKP